MTFLTKKEIDDFKSVSETLIKLIHNIIGSLHDPDEAYEIERGDEVASCNKDGDLSQTNRFIVLNCKPGSYISGITLDGQTHFHDKETMNRWKKTGAHYDIHGALHDLATKYKER